MDVAVVTGHMSGLGGVETLLRTLRPRLAEHGHQLTCWLPAPSPYPAWDAEVAARYYGTAAPALINVDPAWGLTVNLMATWAEIPRPDVIVAGTPFLCAVSRAVAERWRPRPLVASWVQVSLRAWPGQAHLIRFADGHLAIGTALETELRSVAGSDPVWLVRNGIAPPPGYLPRPAVPTFLYVGRLDNRQKRIDKLLRALAPLREEHWWLDIVGEGPDRSALETLAQQLGLGDHVRWRGFQAEPFESVGAATVLVLPSDWEGLGLVLVEALARGIPVIASDCPVGLRDIVRPGHNGWLFPPQAVDTLRRLLAGIVRGYVTLPDPEVCRASVAAYSVDTMTEAFEKALTALSAVQPS